MKHSTRDSDERAPRLVTASSDAGEVFASVAQARANAARTRADAAVAAAIVERGRQARMAARASAAQACRMADAQSTGGSPVPLPAEATQPDAANVKVGQTFLSVPAATPVRAATGQAGMPVLPSGSDVRRGGSSPRLSHAHGTEVPAKSGTEVPHSKTSRTLLAAGDRMRWKLPFLIGAAVGGAAAPTATLEANNQTFTYQTNTDLLHQTGAFVDGKIRTFNWLDGATGHSSYYHSGGAEAAHIANNIYRVDSTTPITLTLGNSNYPGAYTSNIIPVFMDGSYGGITSDYSLKFQGVSVDAAGAPIHTLKVATTTGLYSVAFRWMASNYSSYANIFHATDFELSNFIVDGGANPGMFKEAATGSGGGKRSWYEFLQVDYRNMTVGDNITNNVWTHTYSAYNRPAGLNPTSYSFDTADSDYDITTAYFPLKMNLDNTIFKNFHNVNDGATVMTVGRDAAAMAYIEGNITFTNNWNEQTGTDAGAGVISAGRGNSAFDDGVGYIVFSGDLLFDANYSKGRAGALEVFKKSRVEFHGETTFKDNESERAAGAIYLGYSQTTNIRGGSSLRFEANATFTGNHVNNAPTIYTGDNDVNHNVAGAIYVFGSRVVSGLTSRHHPSQIELAQNVELRFVGNYVSRAGTNYDYSVYKGSAGALVLDSYSDMIVGDANSGESASIYFHRNYSERKGITNSGNGSGNTFTAGAGALKMVGDVDLSFYGKVEFKDNYSYLESERTSLGTAISTNPSVFWTDAGAVSVGSASTLRFHGETDFIGNHSTAHLTATSLNGSGYLKITTGSGVFEIGQNSTIVIAGEATFEGNYSDITYNPLIESSLQNSRITRDIGAGVVTLGSNSELIIGSDPALGHTDNVEFRKNWSGASGGVVKVTGTGARIDFTSTANVRFDENYAKVSGGAIYIGQEDATLTLGNAASILFNKNHVYSTTNTFSDSSATGGAIAILKVTAGLTQVGKTDFTNNYVYNSRPGAGATALGGAIFIGGEGRQLSGNYSLQTVAGAKSIFTGNWAFSQNGGAAGGVIAITPWTDANFAQAPTNANVVHARIHFSEFKDNYAVTGAANGKALGGALYINTGSFGTNVGRLEIGDNANNDPSLFTIFQNNYVGYIDGTLNTTTLGGAVYLNEGTLHLEGQVVFVGNRQNVKFTPGGFDADNKPLPPIPDLSTGESNAIYFGDVANSSILEIAPDADSYIRFYDKVAAAPGHFVNITKIGAGRVAFFNQDIAVKSSVTVSDGIWRLALDKGLGFGGTQYGDPAASSVSFDTVDGNFVINGKGLVLGEFGATLIAQNLAISQYGRIGVRGRNDPDYQHAPAGAFIVQTTAASASLSPSLPTGASAKDMGGVGGDGILRFELKGSPGTLLQLNTAGGSNFAVDTRFFLAADREAAANGDADAVFQIQSQIVGGGKLHKMGAGTWLADTLNSYSGGTQINEGKIFIQAGTQTSDYLGAGALTVNQWKPDPAGDAVDASLVVLLRNAAAAPATYTLNALTAHNDANTDTHGTRSGLIAIDLGKTNLQTAGVSPWAAQPAAGVLVTSNTAAFDGTLRLENLYFRTAPGASAASLPAANIELGAGALLVVPAGTNNVRDFTFIANSAVNAASPKGAIRFEDSGSVVPNSYVINSALHARNLDLTAGGIVQLDGRGRGAGTAGNLNDLFQNNATPLLLRDTFGIIRQLIKSDNPVVGDTSGLTLADGDNAGINVSGVQTPLIQNDAHTSWVNRTTATQYLRMSSSGSLNTGFNNDGLYIGAQLEKLELLAGETTAFKHEPLAQASQVNADDARTFSVPITGTGNLLILAGTGVGEKITLAPPSVSNNNTYTGTTTVRTGTLKTATANAIASSSSLILENGTTFNTGEHSQIVQRLSSTSLTATVDTTELASGNHLTLRNPAGGDSAYNGKFVGTATIIKDGPGTLTISGTNHTHTGDFEILDGTLHVSGTIGGALNHHGTATTPTQTTAHAGNISIADGAKLEIRSATQVIAQGGHIQHHATSTAKTGSVHIVSGGNLEVHGRISLPLVVESGGTLSGSAGRTGYVPDAVRDMHRIEHVTFNAGAILSPGPDTTGHGGATMLTPIAEMKFGPKAGTGTTTFSLNGITYKIDLAPATPDTYAPTSGTDTVSVNGAVSFGDTSPMTLNLNFLSGWQEGGIYKILGTEDGSPITIGDTSQTTFLINGTPWNLSALNTDPVTNRRRTLDLLLSADKTSLFLYTRAIVGQKIFWDDFSTGTGRWDNTDLTNLNWRPGDKLGGTAADDVSFHNEDLVVFDGSGALNQANAGVPSTFSAPKTIQLPNIADVAQLRVSQMTSQTSDAAHFVDITFTGGSKIAGLPSTDPQVLAAGGDGSLNIGPNTRLTFSTTGGTLFEKATVSGELVVKDTSFNMSTPASGPVNPIKVFDAGRVVLTGTGTLASTGAASHNTAKVYLGSAGSAFEIRGAVPNNTAYEGMEIYGVGSLIHDSASATSIKGNLAYNGPTQIKNGTLTVKSLLGTWTPTDLAAGTGAAAYGTYNGEMRLGGSLKFDQDTAATQTLTGEITRGDLGHGALIKAGSNTVRLTNHYSTGSPAITVDAGTLEIAGRLGVYTESFDGGAANPPMGATYYHANHTGDITLNGGTLQLNRNHGGAVAGKPGSDYQLLTGNLTGTAQGTLLKTGAAPVYFMGDARGYQGTLTVRNGVFGIAPRQQGTGVDIWGTAANPAAGITVGTSSGTQGSATASLALATGLINVGNFTLFGDGFLHIAPGGTVKINIGASLTTSIQLHSGARYLFSLVAQDAVTTLPAGKLDLRNTASGAPGATGLSGGVLAPLHAGIQIAIPAGPDYTGMDFVLINGLDLGSAFSSHAISTPLATGSTPGGVELASRIFGIDADALMLNNSKFSLYFTSDGKLVLTGLEYGVVPEPSTYALCGGLGALALALFRRRNRNRKHPPPAAPAAGAPSAEAKQNAPA